MDQDTTLAAIRQRLLDDASRKSLLTLAEYVALRPDLALEIGRSYADCLEETSAARGSAARSGDDDEDMIGSSLGEGRYDILERLGAGGQARVFLASDRTLGRRVALKVFPATGLVSPRQRERVRREGQIASRLEHPGICAVHDTGEDRGFTYLVMRHVEGRTLSALIRQRVEAGSASTQSLFYGFDDERGSVGSTVAVTPAQAGSVSPAPTSGRSRGSAGEIDEILRLVAGAARALHAAHEAGIVHRDVKPNNIMVTPELQPVILDFGMARDDDSEGEGLTLSGEVFGTPSYMSPEQVSGRRGLVDRRTDVYALGVTLYECLTLHRPFTAPTREQLFEQILHRDPVDPREFNPAISRDLAVVLATAMTKEADRRYQTALDLALEIDRVLAGMPILARPIGPLGRFQRWFRRNPALAGSATAAFVILIAATAITWSMALEARRERDRADARTREYESLADARRLAALQREAEVDLLPIVPERAAAMQAWLERARRLVAGLSEHERNLAELRRRGQSISPEHRAVDLGAEVDVANAAERKPTPAIERVVGTGGKAEVIPGDDLVREFARPEDAWHHEQLVELIRGIRRLAADARDDVTIPAVERRLARAEALGRRSITDHAEAWSAASLRVETSPVYRGLKLAPQMGLVPLGPNAEGYEEFRHLPTAAGDEGGIILVLLPGGRGIELGSSSSEPGRRADEMPQRVDLEPFFIARHEISIASWRNLLNARLGLGLPLNSDRGEENADLPIAGLSARDGDRFAAACGLVLPSEAQWEYACRGGTRSAYWWGDDEEPAFEFANVSAGQFESDSLTRESRPVETGGRNPFGLYGLHGNLAEWCAENYQPRRDGKGRSGNGVEFSAAERSYRDGSFLLPAVFARSAARHKADPDVRVKTFGLRPVRRLD